MKLLTSKQRESKSDDQQRTEHRHVLGWFVVLSVLVLFGTNYLGSQFGWTPFELGRVEIAVLIFAFGFVAIFMDTDEERRAWWQERQETLEKAREIHARLDALEDRLDRPSKR